MQSLEEVLTRGVEQIYPDKLSLQKALESRRLRIYCGFDPTGNTLHLGHVVNLLKLRAFHQLGHDVFVVIGSFTARIGDPDKAETRTKLTPDQVKENMADYVRQIRIFFPEVDNEHIKYNSDWLDKMDLSEMLEYLSYFTHAQIIERDLFQERLKKGSALAMSELMYPILQAIDSDKLDIDLELGGADQTFNMLIGKELMRKKNNKEKFVLTNRLLVDEKGEKAGKTTGNMIAITDNPAQIRDKVSKISNSSLVAYAEGTTDWDEEKIEKFKTSPNYTELAEYYITKIYPEEKLNNLNIFVTEKISVGEKFDLSFENPTASDVIAGTAIAGSKSEAKRKISEGIYIDGKIFNNPFEPIKNILGNKTEIIASTKKKGNKIKITK